MKKAYVKQLTAAVLLGLVSTSASMTAYAAPDSAESIESFDLEDYVVTANRMQVKKSEVAADTVVISAEKLNRGNYTSVTDALRDSNIQVVQKPGGNYPVINGDSRVLVMINGRRASWNHLVVSGDSNVAVDIDQFPLENIERIEIVRGPNSSLYGNNAVAGVVNIITKKGATEDKVTLRGEVGSFQHRKGSIIAKGGDDDLQYFISASRQMRGHYRYKTPSGKTNHLYNTEVNKNTESLRLDKAFGEDTLTFEFQNTDRNDGYSIGANSKTKAGIDNGLSYNPNQNLDSTERKLALTYHWATDIEGAEDFLSIYHNQAKSDSGYTGSTYSHNLKTWGADYQKNWKTGDKNHIIGGLSYLHEKINEENNGIEMHKSSNTQSVYIDDHWKLGQGWSVDFGSRYEKHSVYGGDVTGHVGVNKQLSPVTTTFLSWGQGINNPTLKMRYASTQFWKGNPNLEQEKAWTLTWGIKSDITPKTHLETSLYYSRLRNALDWSNGYSDANGNYIPGEYININEEKRRGMEVSLTHKLSDQWNLLGAYSYAYSKVKDSGLGFEPTQDNARPNGYRLGLGYTQDKWKGDASLERVTGRSQLFAAQSYTLLNVGVNYQAGKDTKLYLKGLNLTNESYDSHAKGSSIWYMQPGRSFIFGIEHSL